jgi:TPR repeat protein
MRKSIILAAALLAFGSMVAMADPLQDGARFFQRADYQRALASWRPLAVQGNPVAQNNLGIMYLDGKGVPQNTSEAVRYLSLSAAAGSSLGQNNLGGLYRDGKGVPRDYGKAAQWFAASASQGNSAGMYNLGLMYEMGQGIKAEPFHAYMWYALAADMGSMPNAAAHRNALWSRMTPAAQNQARTLAVSCKRQSYRGCR